MSSRLGRQFFINKAKEHASKQGSSQQAFDSFLSGVNLVLKELDGKTVVNEQTDKGAFVANGTVTGSFSWALKDIEYGPAEVKS